MGALLLGGAAIVAGLTRRGMSMTDAKFTQAKWFKKGRITRPIWVVIHTAETPETSQVAESLAKYAASSPDDRHVSWHYAVDNDSITQSVSESDTAFAAGPGNDHGVHIELAGSAAQSAAGWADPFSLAVLRQAAGLVAQIANRYDIPLSHPDTEGVLNLTPGIVGHDQISLASAIAQQRLLKKAPWYSGAGWRTTNHGDPGANFPWALFIDMVREARQNPSTSPAVLSRPRRTQLNERGPDVTAWQQFLNSQGFGPLSTDGIHGPRTEAASLSWEKKSA